MKRGEVWTLRDDAYASMARPVGILDKDDMAEVSWQLAAVLGLG